MSQAERVLGLEGVVAAAAGPGRGLPPVHLWNPAHCGEIDIVIARNGLWFHEGTPIGREGLVRLFSTVLRKDPDGFHLVTPAEKLRIQVEDAPFIAIRVDEAQDDEGRPVLRFLTNVGDVVDAGPDNPIRVETARRGRRTAPLSPCPPRSGGAHRPAGVLRTGGAGRGAGVCRRSDDGRRSPAAPGFRSARPTRRRGRERARPAGRSEELDHPSPRSSGDPAGGTRRARSDFDLDPARLQRSAARPDPRRRAGGPGGASRRVLGASSPAAPTPCAVTPARWPCPAAAAIRARLRGRPRCARRTRRSA